MHDIKARREDICYSRRRGICKKTYRRERHIYIYMEYTWYTYMLHTHTWALELLLHSCCDEHTGACWSIYFKSRAYIHTHTQIHEHKRDTRARGKKDDIHIMTYIYIEQWRRVAMIHVLLSVDGFQEIHIDNTSDYAVYAPDIHAEHDATLLLRCVRVYGCI